MTNFLSVVRLNYRGVFMMVKRHQLYEYDYNLGKISLNRKSCPRCGRVMAKHGNRYSCGYCGYTIYIKKSS